MLDLQRTGNNIKSLAKSSNITVSEIQKAMGFTYPVAIYKWFKGESCPNIDNLIILSDLFNKPIDDIIIRD